MTSRGTVIHTESLTTTNNKYKNKSNHEKTNENKQKTKTLTQRKKTKWAYDLLHPPCLLFFFLIHVAVISYRTPPTFLGFPYTKRYISSSRLVSQPVGLNARTVPQWGGGCPRSVHGPFSWTLIFRILYIYKLM